MLYTSHTFEEMFESLKCAYKDKKPFSLVAIGDAEQIFLACPEIATTPNLDKYLSISGTTSTMEKLKKDILNLIPENDYIFTHNPANKDCDPRIKSPAWDWARFFYMCPEIFERYNIHDVKLVFNLPKRYEMISDGSLFDAIDGAKVLLVGFYAPEVEKRMKNPDFVKHYEKMNLHKIKVVGSIGCSEFSKVGDEVYDMVEKTKEFDYDVALIGMGIPSNYFAPKVKQMGKIVLDVGHVMSALAGYGDNNRNHISNFDYKEDANR